ncbi:alpha,alpha-trehalose-phosphate synthase (UDP-forming) [Dactylosporangium sp. CS-033363]|uniref:alpha,alpha-trehalose-phosphate synthase (UDP-forming) n=1 Tax=Dactylosporangium sp. CS-033363 TaxID=3239935 RepID=UPI003D93D2DB
MRPADPGATSGRHALVVVTSLLPADDAAWARALRPVLADRGGAWVGWDGGTGAPPGAFEGVALRPVGLSAAEVADHLEGQCASTIVPLYHDAVERPTFHRRWRRAYRAVNERYAAAATGLAAPGGTVWVHGHELQLVPAVLRAVRPDLTIGCYLPLPIPPAELFGRMPMRKEIVDGLLGSDVIGVPDRRSADNLRRLAARHGGPEHDGRVRVEALPMGADAGRVERLAGSPDVARRLEDLRRELRGPRAVLLAVDRLDATSGAEQRLAAFGELLADGRLRADDCVLVQVVVPAARQSAGKARIRMRVEQLVARINGAHSAVGRPAVHYLHQHLDPVDLVALYRLADVFLATPLRDGVNLTAKAFLAARLDDTGVLVLSEFSGIADELPEAVGVNPYDVEDLKRAIAEAIDPHRTAAGDRAAMARMRRTVRRHDVHWWTGSVVATLDGAAGNHTPARSVNNSQNIH